MNACVPFLQCWVISSCVQLFQQIIHEICDLKQARRPVLWNRFSILNDKCSSSCFVIQKYSFKGLWFNRNCLYVQLSIILLSLHYFLSGKDYNYNLKTNRVMAVEMLNSETTVFLNCQENTTVLRWPVNCSNKEQHFCNFRTEVITKTYSRLPFWLRYLSCFQTHKCCSAPCKPCVICMEHMLCDIAPSF